MNPAQPNSSLKQRVPDAVWTPLVTALITLVPGIVGIAKGRLLLFPSLGPTAIMQAHDPENPCAKFYNAVVSHLVRLGSAFVAVALFGIAYAPFFEVKQLSWERVAASVLAVALAAALELLLRASHPPAVSTTLLASLGSFHPTVRDIVAVVVGVLIVAGVGEWFRRLRVSSPPVPPPPPRSSASG